MRLSSRFNVVAAVRDLAGFIRLRQRHEFVAAALALLVTGWIVYAFSKDSYMERQPDIVYVESWPATRTDAQIRREITADQAERDKAQAAQRAQYRAIADQLGIKY